MVLEVQPLDDDPLGGLRLDEPVEDPSDLGLDESAELRDDAVVAGRADLEPPPLPLRGELGDRSVVSGEGLEPASADPPVFRLAIKQGQAEKARESLMKFGSMDAISGLNIGDRVRETLSRVEEEAISEAMAKGASPARTAL